MSNNVNQDLLAFRNQIDAIDQEILKLLNKRASLAQSIGHVKAKVDAPVMRPEREAQVLAALTEANNGPLQGHHVQLLFKEIMSACRSLERQVHVAFLGPWGTYTEQAVWSFFGRCVEAEPLESIEETFRQLECKQVDFAVVPVENSTEGAVARTLDALVDSTVSICGEVLLPIHHQLLCQSGSLEGITRICAHSQALAQCRHWLARHAQQIPVEVVASNGAAAKLASDNPQVAAIAGRAARERYGLQVYQENIQDDASNTTRFWVLGHQATGPSGADKTSLVLSVANQPGAVYHMLEPFQRQNVSMTRLESRPAKTAHWEYNFFIDIQGHQTEPALAQALDELKQKTTFFRILGSYPAAQLSPLV